MDKGSPDYTHAWNKIFSWCHDPRNCNLVFYFHRLQFILHQTFPAKAPHYDALMAPLFYWWTNAKITCKDIQAVLNILDPCQTTTLWPDPHQTTLKANETLYFITLSITHRNFLPPSTIFILQQTTTERCPVVLCIRFSIYSTPTSTIEMNYWIFFSVVLLNRSDYRRTTTERCPIALCNRLSIFTLFSSVFSVEYYSTTRV